MRLWRKPLRSTGEDSGLPGESAATELTEERKTLVERYTIDADTAASRVSRTTEGPPPGRTHAEPTEAARPTAAVVARPEQPSPDSGADVSIDGGAYASDETEPRAGGRIDAGTLVAFLVLSSAVGLMLVSAADALSRSGHRHGSVLFWLGLLAIFLPVTARLVSRSPSRNERVGLLVLLGLTSYLVKVFRDPFRLLYADEFVHQFNANSILATHALFHKNPILPATPAYPGLEAPTAALSALTGMSTFASGLLIIAVARLIMMLALYLLYETVTGSGRVAGLAAALYAASPHYLFFIADFSYESLALPIAILALAAALRARPVSGEPSRAWLIVAFLLTIGVVVTHHMTSYALIVTLLAICVVPLPWLRRRVARPWAPLAVAVAVTAGWLVLVGRETVGYLSPVILGALRETIRTVQGEARVRQLFGASNSAAQGPAWEHYVGFGSAALVAIAVPFGLYVVWRRYRHVPAAVVFSVAGAVYVGSLVLRLVPSAWVIAARASEFLFIGAGLTLALCTLWVLERFPGLAARVGLVAAAAIVLVGGVISTTPSSTRLAEPYRVSVRGGYLAPQAATAGQWVSDVLGSGNRVAAQAADGRFLLVDGRQHVFSSTKPPVAQILKARVLRPWQISLLRQLGIRYVVTDTQASGADDANGYYFFRNQPQRNLVLARTKFLRAGANPIYDSGNIVVYDLQPGLRLPGPQQGPVAGAKRTGGTVAG